MHRLTQLFSALTVALAIAATGSAALAGTSQAQARSNDATGYVYVNDNTAGTNTIAGFARHADGTLTPLPGSPFSAGGSGSGTITGSQGALQRSSDGRYLLVVDNGSNQISVLRIQPDGTLRTVEGGLVSSGGIAPVSVAVHDDVVYVANDGNGTYGANYSGFRLHRGGHLTPLPQSTVTVPADALPGDILFNGDGTRLVATRVNTSQIDSFVVGPDGRLTAAPGSPYAAQSVGPFGSAFRPTDPTQLFVSNAHAGGGNGSVSAFSYDGTGKLNSIGTSPYADFQTAPCWVAITPDGQFLFAVNTASTTISRFAVAPDGSLTLLGSAALNDASGLRPFDFKVAPDGQYAYVVDAGKDAVSALAVGGNGTLAELPSSPTALPTGATPFGIVVI